MERSSEWEEDPLEFGYVLARRPEGDWWHMHFGRSCMDYHCELLGRRTSILARIQRFARGAVADSPRFILTLDGEGVELPDEELRLDFTWGERAGEPDFLDEARHFQQEVMPLLHKDPEFQQAAAEVVHRQRYLRVAAAGKLRRASSP